MTVSYFDSSILLSIIHEEDRRFEAFTLWRNTDVHCSSTLLKIETIVSLRRSYERRRNVLPDVWLSEKTKILREYLNEVDYYPIDETIEREINLRREISYCRALDAIHIATALQFRTMQGVDNVKIFTFDDRMKALAERFRFEVD